jgi:hypothetical protein
MKLEWEDIGCTGMPTLLHDTHTHTHTHSNTSTHPHIHASTHPRTQIVFRSEKASGPHEKALTVSTQGHHSLLDMQTTEC